MNHIIETYKKYFSTHKLLIEEGCLEAFRNEVNYVNYKRLGFFLWIGLFFAIYILILDFVFSDLYLPREITLYKLFDVFLGAIIITLFFYYKLNKISQPSSVGARHNNITKALIFVLISWIAIVSVIESDSAFGFPTFLTGIVIISTIFYLNSLSHLFYITYGVILLIALLAYKGADSIASFHNYSPIIIMIFISIAVSRILYKSKVDYFATNFRLNNLKDNLDKEVKMKTGQLEKTVAQLQNELVLKKNYQQSLIKAKKRVEDADKLKTIFLANMSHEIRTPMNAILGFSKLLKNKRADKEKQDLYINLINRSGEQLLALINDILDLSLIETNQLKIVPYSINLTEIMEQTMVYFSNFKKEMGKGNIELKFIPDSKMAPFFIIADPVRLQQILNNLIRNSIKFTENGFVHFGYQVKKNELVFFVKDSGIGIKKEKLNIIFDRFRQGDENPEHKRKFGGTGLGLSISKSLLELMNGTITVDSNVGQGTEFRFRIPLLQNESSTQLNIHETMNYNWKNYTILIVEDDYISNELLSEILEPTGLGIIRTAMGKESVEIMKSGKKVDLVIMDIRLPDISGLQATEEIRKFNTSVPIFAQTANALSEDKENCINAGCNEFFSKPVNIEKFLGFMDMYLKNHHRINP